ncbi:MAG: DUF423 domain-containing protein [Planctomycetia bacterium]|nr:DUF423 domain-containing protein [Planctomycetia bacterium]
MAGRNWIVCGALCAAIAVVAGALGTHFLKDRLKPPEAADESDPKRVGRELLSGELPLAQFYEELIKSAGADRLQTYETAVRYQMYHALGLILVGMQMARNRSRLLPLAAAAFLAGIVLFSGGIFGWLLTGAKPLVHVVPIGGVAWIAGWLLLAPGASRGPLRD